MPDCTSKRIEFERFKRRRIEANFDGGDVSSDGGLLLLKEARASPVSVPETLTTFFPEILTTF
jgi:hypothetical protein